MNIFFKVSSISISLLSTVFLTGCGSNPVKKDANYYSAIVDEYGVSDYIKNHKKNPELTKTGRLIYKPKTFLDRGITKTSKMRFYSNMFGCEAPGNCSDYNNQTSVIDYHKNGKMKSFQTTLGEVLRWRQTGELLSFNKVKSRDEGRAEYTIFYRNGNPKWVLGHVSNTAKNNQMPLPPKYKGRYSINWKILKKFNDNGGLEFATYLNWVPSDVLSELYADEQEAHLPLRNNRKPWYSSKRDNSMLFPYSKADHNYYLQNK